MCKAVFLEYTIMIKTCSEYIESINNLLSNICNFTFCFFNFALGLTPPPKLLRIRAVGHLTLIEQIRNPLFVFRKFIRFAHGRYRGHFGVHKEIICVICGFLTPIHSPIHLFITIRVATNPVRERGGKLSHRVN